MVVSTVMCRVIRINKAIVRSPPELQFFRSPFFSGYRKRRWYSYSNEAPNRDSQEKGYFGDNKLKRIMVGEERESELKGKWRKSIVPEKEDHLQVSFEESLRNLL